MLDFLCFAVSVRLVLRSLIVAGRKRRLFIELRRKRAVVRRIDRAYAKFKTALTKCEREKVLLKRLQSRYTLCPVLDIAYDIGKVSVSKKAKEILSETEIASAIERHKGGDWGNLSPEDWSKSNSCLKAGRGFTFSRHRSAYGHYFCIITNLDMPKSKIVTEDEMINCANQCEKAEDSVETREMRKAG